MEIQPAIPHRDEENGKTSNGHKEEGSNVPRAMEEPLKNIQTKTANKVSFIAMTAKRAVMERKMGQDGERGKVMVWRWLLDSR